MPEFHPAREVIDINNATPEQLRNVFHVGDEKVKQIVENRPYRNWADFRERHPEFSDPHIESLKQTGVIVGHGVPGVTG